MTDTGLFKTNLDYADGFNFDSFRESPCQVGFSISSISGSASETPPKMHHSKPRDLSIGEIIASAVHQKPSVSFGRFDRGDYFPEDTIFLNG